MSRMQRNLVASFACLLALSVTKGTAVADNGEWLYLGQRMSLVAVAPRQITLNANLTQFEYSPNGYQIAYIEWPSNLDVSPALGVVSTTEPSSGSPPTPEILQILGSAQGGLTLGDWSTDGRFLAVSAEIDTGNRQTQHVLYSEDLTMNKATPMPAPLETGESMEYLTPGSWSPGGHIYAFAIAGRPLQADPTVQAFQIRHSELVLYDADRNVSRVVARMDGGIMRLLGWQNNHTYYYLDRKPDDSAARFDYDLQTGTIKAVGTKVLPFAPNTNIVGNKTIGIVPELINQSVSLTIEPQGSIRTDLAHQTHGRATNLWVVRGGVNITPQQAAGLVPSHPIILLDTYPESSGSAQYSDSPPRFRPLGLFPDQSEYQVAYASHGDLWLADLTTRPSTSREVLSAGDELPCPEELQLAEENARQIVIALLSYSQDYDDKFPPPGSNLSIQINDYLADPTVMRLGDYHFKYEPPAKLSFVDLDSPADTVLGEFDLPCGKEIAYCDGHVKLSQ